MAEDNLHGVSREAKTGKLPEFDGVYAEWMAERSNWLGDESQAAAVNRIEGNKSEIPWALIDKAVEGRITYRDGKLFKLPMELGYTNPLPDKAVANIKASLINNEMVVLGETPVLKAVGNWLVSATGKPVSFAHADEDLEQHDEIEEGTTELEAAYIRDAKRATREVDKKISQRGSHEEQQGAVPLPSRGGPDRGNRLDTKGIGRS